jgi:hypothetical protein
MRHHRRSVRQAAWSFSCAAGLVLLAGCSASSSPAEEPRYPEKRRPEPARSASDGEVLGAHGQSPEDTLEGSPTNEHPAPGWEGEEPQPAPLKDCSKDPEEKVEAAISPDPQKKKRPCPPAEER